MPPADDDEDEKLAANRRRWAATELPLFRIADWDGRWCLGNSAGLGSIDSDGTHRYWGTTSQNVCHRRPDVQGDAITVTSSRPDTDEYSPQLGNMAIQIQRARPRDHATAEEQNQFIFELEERLGTDDSAWATATLTVDGVPTEFKVLAVDEVWFAFTRLDDLDIEILGHHTPFAGLHLTRITEPPPTTHT